MTRSRAPLPASPAAAPRPAWRDELRAGLAATAAMLPFVLTFGYIVFGAASDEAAQIGLPASVVSVVVAALAMLAVSRAPLPTAAPSASTSLILGTLVVSLLHDPALSPATAGGAERLLACTGATVFGAGLLLLLLGFFRIGRAARFVPQPVLAGFMNGVAIMIVLSQVPILFGISGQTWAREGVAALRQGQWRPFATAAVTVVLVWACSRRFPRWPAPMLALVAASIIALAVQAMWPGSVLDVIGPLQVRWPRPDALGPWLDPAARSLLARHGGDMVAIALLLALIGGLESVLSLAAVDQLMDLRTNPDRELISLGVANIVSALFGGLFLVYLRLRAVATYNGGGRSGRAVIAGCALLAGVFTLGLPLVERLPTAVVAGVVVMLAWTLVDRWTRQLLGQWWHGERSGQLVLSLLIVLVVCAVTVRWGFAVGVAAGVLVAMLIFMRTLNRSLMRLRYRASEIPSRRIYPPALEAALRELRPRIEVLELEGALFFGNAERLADEIERTRSVPSCLVVDLRRITMLDATGAVLLARLDERLARAGTVLLLAGVTGSNRLGRALREQGVQRSIDGGWGYADADRAVEAAEARLLSEAGLSLHGLAVAPMDCALFAGLETSQRDRLCRSLTERRLACSERLFAEGDAGDALYLLGMGSISVADPSGGQRFVSFSPGMCFGETAVLDGGGRTADAVADVDSVVYALPAAALAELRASDPALAAQVYRNLAQHLSERLRAAAAAWRRAAS